MILVLAVFSYSIVGASDLPRHVDPSLLGSEYPFSPQLFELYTSAFGSIIAGEYVDARSLLDTVLMAYAPPDVRESLEEYTDFVVDVIGGFESTESSLEEAVHHLRWLREKLAADSIDEALRCLWETNRTIGILEASSSPLALELKSSAQTLLQGVTELGLHLEDVNLEILGALEEAELIGLLRTAGLRESELVISIDVEEALVGSSASIEGYLVDVNGTGLQVRDVDVFLGGNRIDTVSTDFSGFFASEIDVPFLYQESVSVHAEYWPKEEDVDRFTPSSSDALEISLIYFSPSLKVEVPSVGYPSKTAKVSGWLSFEGEALGGIAVQAVSFGRRQISKSGEDGFFEFDIAVPSDVVEGMADVVVESKPSDLYGPVRVVEDMEITRLPVSLVLDKPSWTFSGGYAEIEGLVSFEGVPLGDCMVEVKGRNQVEYVRTLSDGKFVAYLEYPLISLSSRYPFSLKVVPEEPWLRSVAIDGDIFVVNVVTLFCAPVFLGAAVFYVLQRNRDAGFVASKVDALDVSLVGSPSDMSSRGGFEGLYLRALGAIALLSEVVIRPSNTIREYLALISGKVSAGIFSVFERLSLLYERWVYGRKRGGPPLRRAERMLEDLEDNSEFEG